MSDKSCWNCYHKIGEHDIFCRITKENYGEVPENLICEKYINEDKIMSGEFVILESEIIDLLNNIDTNVFKIYEMVFHNTSQRPHKERIK